jgi:hypothetical protein
MSTRPIKDPDIGDPEFGAPDFTSDGARFCARR